MMLHEGDDGGQHNLLVQQTMEVDMKSDVFMHAEPVNGPQSTTSSSSSRAGDINDLMDDELNQNSPHDSKTTGKSSPPVTEELPESSAATEANETAESINQTKSDSLRDAKIDEISEKFIYLQHQLSRIMRQLHIPACVCESCTLIHQNVTGLRQLNEPAHMLAQLFPNASEQQLKTLLDLSKMNKMPGKHNGGQNGAQPPQQQQQQQQQNSVLQQSQPQQQQAQSQKNNLLVGMLGTGYGNHNGGGKMLGCNSSSSSTSSSINNGSGANNNNNANGYNGVNTLTNETKKLFAEYARIHGPLAAAKKYGLTQTSVYHRKDSAQSLNNGLLNGAQSNSANASPGPSSDSGEDAPQLSQQSNSEAPASMPNTPGVMQKPLFQQAMVDILKMNANAAHSTGSPGFLRGRGRGRPKLIGDELDADLVDYMVQVKQNDPHGHLTASQALQIARQYILERAPGLLEEHGGHVKLKLTWAMKLVTRIAERQKEIELGLPAGTLSTIGRNVQTLPGGNFMADMMAQNMLPHQMMMVNQMGNNGMKAEPAEATVASQQVAQPAPTAVKSEPMDENSGRATAAEIVNIKELNLPFLNNFLAELNENRKTIVEGEIQED